MKDKIIIKSKSFTHRSKRYTLNLSLNMHNLYESELMKEGEPYSIWAWSNMPCPVCPKQQNRAVHKHNETHNYLTFEMITEEVLRDYFGIDPTKTKINLN